MTRNLNALAMALGALLASSALVAPIASAGSLSASSYPAILHGEQVSGESHVFTLTDDESLTIKCSTITFTGTLSETSSTVSVHPDDGGESCTGFLGIEASVAGDDCDLLAHIGNTTGGSGHYAGTVDLVKSGSESCGLFVTAATCQVAVEAQTGLGSLTAINMGGTDVTIKAELKNIGYLVTKDGLFCPLKNGKGSGVEGDYTGNTTFTAKNTEGKAVNLSFEM
jgi:hypothetical protein